MTDALPHHQEIEETIEKAPLKVLEKLPDCIESRRAKDHILIARDYAYRAREKVAASDPGVDE